MDLLKRLANLFRSNFNAVMDAAEDPIKMTDQMIFDMQEREKMGKRKLIELLALEKTMATNSQSNDADLNSIKEQREKLQQFMSQVPDFIIRAKKKRDELYAKNLRADYNSRKKGAPAVPEINALEDNRAFETFDRMVEKVEVLEAESQALIELSSMLNLKK